MNYIPLEPAQELPPQAPSPPLRTALLTLLSQSLAGIHLLMAEGSPMYHALAAALRETLQLALQGLACEEDSDYSRRVHTIVARLHEVMQQISTQRGLDGLAAPLPRGGTLPSLAASEQPTSPPLLRFPTDLDPELASDFIIEVQEHIASAEEALLALETDPEDREALDAVFRAFHTVKGTATFLGLPPIAQLAHYTESLLSRMRDGAIRCLGGYADLALRATDMLKELVYILQETLTGAPSRFPQTFMDFLATLARPEVAGISEEVAPVPPPRLGDLLVAEGLVQRQELETIAATSQGKPLGLALLRSGIVSLPEVAHALRTQQRLSGTERAMRTSVQVRTVHLEHLRDLVGDFMTAYTAMMQDEAVTSCASVQHKLNPLGKTLHSLQAVTTEMCLVPCDALFQKMTRVIRDVAKQSHKLVTFVTAGEDTSLDRHTAEMLTAPLMHMVCNAVSHGIEPPESRVQCGKTRIGMVCLQAYHADGHVVLELQDDGKGLDREAIRVKALKKGLISSEKRLSERDIDRLILQPGFSTAVEVSEVSGRGVGMDVVRRNIEMLKGRIEVTSTQGQGTTFTLSLPLPRL